MARPYNERRRRPATKPTSPYGPKIKPPRCATAGSATSTSRTFAEELEALVRSNRREIVRRLTLVAMHLLKLEFQPAKETRSWRNTIRVQARDVEEILADSPSLRRELPTFIAKAYANARKDAAAGETALPLATFPQTPTPAFRTRA